MRMAETIPVNIPMYTIISLNLIENPATVIEFKKNWGPKRPAVKWIPIDKYWASATPTYPKNRVPVKYLRG